MNSYDRDFFTFDWDFTSIWSSFVATIKADIESDLSAVEVGTVGISNSFSQHPFGTDFNDDISTDYSYYFVPSSDINDI